MGFEAGQRLGGYELREPLGVGGQGSVWKAVDAVDPDQSRALKLVDVRNVGADGLERIRREARVLVRLSHPSLVHCHGTVEDSERGVLGLVLDCVEGPSIASARQDPRFTLAHRFAALLHVARALGHVHAAELVHRDVKPQNVLLDPDFWSHPEDPSTVKLVDFGISVDTGNLDKLTQSGRVVGTPPYMAPEAIDSTSWMVPADRPVSDVFAFGVTAWELLVGGHPTGLSPDSTLVDYARAYRDVLERGYPWPPHSKITGAWGDALARCLALEARNRPASGTVVVETLGEALVAPEARQRERPPRRKRHPARNRPSSSNATPRSTSERQRKPPPRDAAIPPQAPAQRGPVPKSVADSLSQGIVGAVGDLSKILGLGLRGTSMVGVVLVLCLLGVCSWFRACDGKARAPTASGTATTSPASRQVPRQQPSDFRRSGGVQPRPAPR